MLVFVTASGHEFTNRKVLGEPGAPPSQRVSYRDLLGRASLRPAAYVFTDFDRLAPRELQFAAGLYQKVKAAGWPALNDPARVRQRYAMLRHLKAEGVNQFGAYRLESGEMPERYPVFIRNECDHFGPLTDLLADPSALREAHAKLLADGHPERNLIAVEFAGEPFAPNLYRRLGAFRIGDRIVPTVSSHEARWATRQGTKGIARQEDYEEEHLHVRDNPFRDVVMRAFEVARIDYGRADFGIVGGRVQIYEINTNPALGRSKIDHPFPVRIESFNLFRQNYLAALRAIDVTPSGTPIPLVEGGLPARLGLRLRSLRGRLKFE